MEEDKPSQQAYIALVLSILGCMGCGGCITGIIGAIMGKMELDKISRGESSAAGAGISKIAIALGIIEVIFVGIALIAYFAIFVIAAANS